MSAVQNPLTSLPDDIERTTKLAAAQDGPTLMVGASLASHAKEIVALIEEAAASFM